MLLPIPNYVKAQKSPNWADMFDIETFLQFGVNIANNILIRYCNKEIVDVKDQ